MKSNLTIKPKTCKAPGCGNKFTPSRPLQRACSIDCAIVLANIAKKKKEASKVSMERRERKAAKDKIKSRGEWLKEAQAAFNFWIRSRDDGIPCISCGTLNGQRHASHFYATSIRPNLRFDPDNVHASCAKCNKWMHGNLIPYRENLEKKIGKEALARLDADIQPKHYSIEDLKEIKAKYSKLARELRKGRE